MIEWFRGDLIYCLMQLYERRYRVTLSPTTENIERALSVYDYAVKNYKSLIGAIVDLYGYRYRRLENFMRELGLWREGKWLHVKVLARSFAYYPSRKPVHAELTFNWLNPITVFTVDKDYLLSLLYKVVEETEFAPVTPYLTPDELRTGIEFPRLKPKATKEECKEWFNKNFAYFRDTEQVCEGELLVTTRYYDYPFDVLLPIECYLVNGFKLRL